MAKKSGVSVPKEAILERVSFLIGSGQTLASACALIESETGQKRGTTKSQFYRQGEEAALASGVAMKAHGNRKLTDRQEAKMRAVLAELSKQDEKVSAGALVEHVERLFGVSVSSGWAKRFLKADTNDTAKKKAKLPAKKRRAKTIAQDSVSVGDHQGASKRSCRSDHDHDQDQDKDEDEDEDNEELDSSSQVTEKATTKEEIQDCDDTHTNRYDDDDDDDDDDNDDDVMVEKEDRIKSLRIQVETLTRRNEELEALLKKMIGIADYAVKKANTLEEEENNKDKETRRDVDDSAEATSNEQNNC